MKEEKKIYSLTLPLVDVVMLLNELAIWHNH